MKAPPLRSIYYLTKQAGLGPVCWRLSLLFCFMDFLSRQAFFFVESQLNAVIEHKGQFYNLSLYFLSTAFSQTE